MYTSLVPSACVWMSDNSLHDATGFITVFQCDLGCKLCCFQLFVTDRDECLTVNWPKE